MSLRVRRWQGGRSEFLKGVHLGHRTPLPCESIFKVSRALVIKKKLDLTHLELKFMGTAAIEANPLGRSEARSLPKVDDCWLSVPACFEW